MDTVGYVECLNIIGADHDHELSINQDHNNPDHEHPGFIARIMITIITIMNIYHMSHPIVTTYL